MSRKHYEWKLRDKTLRLGEHTLVMGILNVTPDSFSDGGKYADPDRAFARALELEEQGADIIDIGAESTRPGSARVSEAEELRRLIPVLKRLQGRLTIPISVDTYKSAVAAKALELGAEIINDPSGLTFDPDLARAAAKANAGLILNHMRGTPETWAKLPPLKDPILTIATELDSATHRAIRAGVDRKRIVADPGLGFGKRKEQNSEILARLDEFQPLDLPLMVGASRKHFVAKPSEDRTEFASAAAVTASILNGAHIVRVHDVVAMKAVIEVADEIARARAEREEAERAAKAALREEAKRSSGPRRDASPSRQQAGPQRFSVPVVTGVARPSAFPLRSTRQPDAPVATPATFGAVLPSVPAESLVEASQDDFLPSYGTPDLVTGELPDLGDEHDLEESEDLDLEDKAPARYAAPTPAKREFTAKAPDRRSKEGKQRKGAGWEGKPRGFRPGGPRPEFKRRDEDDARRSSPPARRGAYSRQEPSDAPRPSDREGSADRGRPAFRGKPPLGKKPFGKKPSFGRKPFGDKPEFGDRKRFAGKPSFGRKSFGDERESGDKAASGEKPAFGNKPRFGGKKLFGGKPSFGRKPGGKFRGKPRGKPSGRSSPGHD